MALTRRRWGSANCWASEPRSESGLPSANFALPQGVTLEQFGDRRQLLSSFDTLRREVDGTGQMSAMDRFGHQAWDILTSPAARTMWMPECSPKR